MNALTTFTDSRLAYTVESKSAWRKLGRSSMPRILEIPMLFDKAQAAAETLCDRLLAQLGPRYAIRLIPWKLTVTQFPTLTEIIAREALRAPFLLVTINGATPLTPEVEALIRRCAAALRRGGAALVVQLYGIAKAEQELSPAYVCLKQIADDAQILIFSTVVERNQNRGAGQPTPYRQESPFRAACLQTSPQT
jgi:hypothetical protein